jgi:hypothetical protein
MKRGAGLRLRLIERRQTGYRGGMAAKKAPKKPPATKKTTAASGDAKPKGRAAPKAKGRAAPKTAPKAAPKAEKAISSLAVNRGHLFALRPRVSTAFRPEDFLTARRELEDERYESIEAAARAVAERALALSNDTRKTKRDFQPGR